MLPCKSATIALAPLSFLLLFCLTVRAQVALHGTSNDDPPAPIVDLLKLSSSKTVHLHQQLGPGFYNDSKEFVPVWKYPGRKRIHFDRLFRDPENPEHFYVAAILGADRKKGFAIYHFAGDYFKVVHDTKENSNPIQYWQSQTGDIFAASRRGTIYRVRDGKVAQFEIQSEVRSKSSFREMRFAESSRGSVCIYSVMRQNSKQLSSIVLSQEGDFEQIDLLGSMAGPACFIDDNNLLMSIHGEFVTIHIKTRKISKSKIELPRLNGKEVVLDELIRIKDGEAIGVFRNKFHSMRHYDVNNFAKGNFHRLAELKEEKWTWTDVYKDRLLYRPRLHRRDSEGGLWLTSCEGRLLYRSSTGNWQTFDEKENSNCRRIDHLHVTKNGVWAFDHERQFGLFFDKKKLIDLQSQGKSSKSNRWSLVYSRSALATDKEGFVSLINTSFPNKVQYFGEKPALVDLPDIEQVRPSGSVRLAYDSNNRLWFFRDQAPDATAAKLSSGWKVWSNKEKDVEEGQLTPTSKQQAFTYMLENGSEAGFEIGNDFEKYKVVYGPEKQIVFNSIGNRVFYFNGKHWYSKEIWHASHPRFENDRLLIPYYGSCYTLPYEIARNLEQGDTMTLRRERVAVKRTPKPVLTWKLPSEVTNQYGLRNLQGQMLFNAKDHIAIRFGPGLWSVINQSETPFIGGDMIENFYLDPVGRIFIELKTSYIHRFAIFDPPDIFVEVVDHQLDALESQADVLKPRWKTETRGLFSVRYRIDQGDWSTWREADKDFAITAFGTKGKHDLQLQVKPLRTTAKAKTLNYTFEVKYDLARIVQQLCEELGKVKFADRIAATEKLLEFGPEIIPLVEPYVKSKDVEVSMRAKLVVNGLQKKAK